MKALFFDLDGTLINSRDDIADSVNLALAEMNFPMIEPSAVFDFIGEGVVNLLRRSLIESLGENPDEARIKKTVEVFKIRYAGNCLVKTVLYDEVARVLDELNGFKKAVVTNKPYKFSVDILHGLGVSEYFETVAGGDTFPERKPHAMPLLAVAESLGVEPKECVMIGDSRVDIEAGKNAGIKTIGCIYGFRGRRELEEAGADFLIEKFADLPHALTGVFDR